MNILVDCEPYRYEIEETNVTFTGTGEWQCVLSNDRMWVVPAITATKACSMVYGSSIISLEEGEQKIADFILKEGDTQLYIFGDTSLTFRYRKGCL